MKGTIALDIDGTITGPDHQIPDSVVDYLTDLTQEGWALLLVTGRSYVFASMALYKLNFPYLLALQNGADIISMPDENLLFRHYLAKEKLFDLDRLCDVRQEDFLIYSGFGTGDFCYYRPSKFSKQSAPYIESLQKLSSKPWQEVDDFKAISQGSFPLIKCIGTSEELAIIDHKLKSDQEITHSIIHDPISKKLNFILITHKKAEKAMAVNSMMQHARLKRPLIAAGDDYNDYHMIKSADFKIVMEKAPDSIRLLADFVAPSEAGGIIKGLKQAISHENWIKTP